MRDNSRRKSCKVCRRARAEDELFSWRGLCRSCSRERIELGMDQGRLVEDPDWWRKWRAGLAASIGLEIPEQPERGDQ